MATCADFTGLSTPKDLRSSGAGKVRFFLGFGHDLTIGRRELHLAPWQGWIRRMRRALEFHAIETDESALMGADPEVAVRSLRQTGHRAARQAVVRRPDIHHETRDVLRRFHRACLEPARG